MTNKNAAWMLITVLLASRLGAAVGEEDARPPRTQPEAEEAVSAVEDRKAEELAERFKVSRKEVLDMRKSRMGWGEINHALAIARKSGKPLAEILSLRESGLGWGEIAKKYGFKLGEAAGKGKEKERTEPEPFRPQWKHSGHGKERDLRDAPNKAEREPRGSPNRVARGPRDEGRQDKTEHGWGRGGVRR